MPDYLTVLERASQSDNPPGVTEVVEALLTAEKTAKKSKEAHIFPFKPLFSVLTTIFSGITRMAMGTLHIG